MIVGRRNFLRGIIAAGVGALVVPSLPPPEIMAASPVRMITTEEMVAAMKPYTKLLVDWITKPDPFWLKAQELGLIGSEPSVGLIEDVIYVHQ